MQSLLLVFCLFYQLFLTIVVRTQLVSPCPRLFMYEPQQQGQENDRWYGVLTLITDSELSGVWLRLIFDKPSIQLGNWFGEVVTQDNKEYLIKNPRHKLSINQPFKLRFYLKYNPNDTPPQLIGFRLNARTVCPENGQPTEPPTTSGQLLTSSILSTTSAPIPIRPPVQSPVISGVIPPDNMIGTFADEDDFFPGDINLPQRPQLRPPPSVGPTSFNLDAICGTVVQLSPKPLITHGQVTREGDFPWHAALYHARGVDLTYICGGSLVTQYHVITAAHCVTGSKTQRILDPDSLVIYLGKYYLRRWSDTSIQDKHVEKILPHPRYNSRTFSNDIAIIKLSKPAEITNYVRPVCLWEDDDIELQSIVNKPGVVVGWGFDEYGRITEQLTKGIMPVVSQATCIYSYPDFYSRFTSNQTFCAGYRNGTSVCNGDSGGGMVFPKKITNQQQNNNNNNNQSPIWQLRGIISISVALQNQLKCDTSHYVVFTDIAKYMNWIKTNLN